MIFFRASLFFAIIFGAGSFYVSQFEVKKKITGLETDLEATQTELTSAESGQRKAVGDKRNAESAQQEAEEELLTVRDQFDQARKSLIEQRSRAEENSVRANELDRRLLETERNLSAWEALTIKVEDVKNLAGKIAILKEQSSAFSQENGILLKGNRILQAELDRYEGKKTKVLLKADLKGEVTAVDPKWNFIVINIGDQDDVLKGGELLVSREGKLIGKVIVTSVEKNRSIANVLPDWSRNDILEGDQVIASQY